jgi:hypothetical protein
MLTGDSPSTHLRLTPAREVRVLRRHRVGERQGELGAGFTTFSPPRIRSGELDILESTLHSLHHFGVATT